MLKLGLRRTLRGHCCASAVGLTESKVAVWAGVAQLVEHLICNQRVGGSSPFASSSSIPQRANRKTDLVVLLAVLALQTSGHSFKVVSPLDSQFESTTGLMG